MNKSRPRRTLTIAFAALFLCAVRSHAQLPAPPATTEEALRQMLSQAGIVFTGQVTAVRRIPAANSSTGLLEIDFAVDDAIFGAAPNSTYTLREWAGLAPNTESSFMPGRRYLIFLHAPGPSGLTSPVSGPDGAIPILPGNPAASPTTPDTLGLAAQSATQIPQTSATIPFTFPRSRAHTNFRLAPGSSGAVTTTSTSTSSATAVLASSTVDLRWIATHVLTPLAYAPDPESADAPPTLTRPDAELSPSILPASEAFGPASSLPSASPAPPTPTTSSTYPTVLAMLRAWRDSPREADLAPR